MYDTIAMKKLNDHVWLLDDGGATCYLVVGKEKAVLIDSMNGYANPNELIRTVTDLPVTVINTHGHCDHVFGNVYFEECYMNPKDLPVAEEHMQMPEFVEACRKHGLSMPPFREIHEGDTVDLGGLTLEVFDIPGHTPGGILVLLQEDRILFTGDSINRHTWLQLPHTLKLRDCLAAMERIAFLEERADYVAHGHAKELDSISLLADQRRGVAELVNQKGREVTDTDPEYKWFGGVCKQHPFAADSVIVYAEDKLD